MALPHITLPFIQTILNNPLISLSTVDWVQHTVPGDDTVRRADEGKADSLKEIAAGHCRFVWPEQVMMAPTLLPFSSDYGGQCIHPLE